ncbi:MAG TPA: hypothetical protein VGM90_29475 [Kofleriaceae bacterium]|jgi:hypothetical protein
MWKRLLAAFLKICAAIAAKAPASPPAASGMITDDQCIKQGGHIETEDTYAYENWRDPEIPRTRYRVCRYPSKTNGKVCTSSSQCEGHCRCTGALARPEPDNDPALTKFNRTKGKGVCSDAHLTPGTWYCLVEQGTILLQGIIID